MNLELSGKIALVTGASRGIGRAIALALCAEGVRVAMCGRDATALDDAAAAAKAAADADVFTIQDDLSTLDGVSRTVEAAAGRFGKIDVLVNNAGAIRAGDFFKIPDEQWMGDWQLKLLGYVRMCRAVMPIMQRQGGGR